MGQCEIRGRERSDETTSQAELRVPGNHKKMGEPGKDSFLEPS